MWLAHLQSFSTETVSPLQLSISLSIAPQFLWSAWNWAFSSPSGWMHPPAQLLSPLMKETTS